MNNPVYSPTQIALLVILLLFSMLTGVALWQHGFWGIFEQQLNSFGGLQVLVDLAIALTLALRWMWFDAQKTNRAFWPWAVLTLVAGSFGPLLYLLFRKSN